MFDHSVKEDSQEQVFGSCIAKTRKGKKDVQFVLKRQPCMSKYLSSRFNAICTPYSMFPCHQIQYCLCDLYKHLKIILVPLQVLLFTHARKMQLQTKGNPAHIENGQYWHAVVAVTSKFLWPFHFEDLNYKKFSLRKVYHIFMIFCQSCKRTEYFSYFGHNKKVHQ